MASRDLPYSYNMEGYTIPYDRKDYYSIFQYLKDQAENLSQGRWTDFSDADIGTVFLKLMSYLADMNNYHVDKATSELYLDTLLERSNAIALTKLIGYNPRHYISAYTDVTLYASDLNGRFGYNSVVPAFTKFTDVNQTISYYNIDNIVCKDTQKLVVRCYEGNYVKEQFTRADVNNLGRLYLTHYNCGFNTVRVHVGDIELYKHENVALTEGEYVYSIFVDEYNRVYIQLPSFWKDVIDSTSIINVEYLRSSGYNGRIGANVIAQVNDTSFNFGSPIFTNTVSELGLDPETVEDIKISAPEYAKTMETIVTLEDVEIACRQVEGIADAVALDYTKYLESPEKDLPEALVQPQIPDGIPNDCYKLNIYTLPSTGNSIFKDGTLRAIKATYIGPRHTGDTVDLSNFIIYAYYWNVETPVQISISDCDFMINETIKDGDNVFNILYTEDDITVQAQVYVIGQTEMIEGEGEGIEYPYEFISVRAEYRGPTMQAGRVLDIDDIHVFATYDGLNEFEVDDWYVQNIHLTYDSSHLDADGLSDNIITVHYVTHTATCVVKAMENDGLRVKMLTDEATKMQKIIDSRRQAALYVQYYDVTLITPDILIDVYMDKYDLRWSETADAIKNYVITVLARERTRIGHNIIMSQLSAGILNSFTYLKYVEFRNPYMLDQADPYYIECPFEQDPYDPHVCKDPDRLIANSYEYLNIVKSKIVVRMHDA